MMRSSGEFWLFRKQFTMQLAAQSFLSYVFGIAKRTPMRYHICLRTGTMTQTDIQPVTPAFSHGESVPFRITPVLQELMAPFGLEGLFTGSLVAIGSSLLNAKEELIDFISLFIRDEIINWHMSVASGDNVQLHVEHVIENVLKKIHELSSQADNIVII